MTSSSPSFALKSVCCGLLALSALSGCTERTGADAFAEGSAAYAVRDFRKATKAFAECVEIEAGNVDGWMMLARAHLDLAEIPQARKALDAALQLAGGDTDVVEFDGQLAYHERDYARARAAYLKLAADDKAGNAVRSRGYGGLAVIDMASLGKSAPAETRARARVALMEAIRLDSLNLAARYHLGRLYRDAYGYCEAALDQFDIYVRYETQSVDKVQSVQRKVIPGLRDQIAQAAAHRSGVDRRDSAASAAALKKAEEAWKKGTFKTAKLRYNDALVADVLNYEAALGLARCWEKTDPSPSGLREALKYYTAAAQLHPSSRDVLMTCGDLAYRIGNHASAVEAYSRAVAVRPTDISAIDGLIRSLQKRGDAKSAAIYQKYRNGLPVRRK